MINRVKLTGTLILSLITGFVLAQNLNRTIMETYSPFVSSRVYSVLKSAPLNDEKQFQLAELFEKEDSLLSSAKAKKSTNEEINLLRQQTINALNSILNQEELYKYYSYYAIRNYQTDQNTSPQLCQDYINSRIAKLDSIKPLSASIKESLLETFVKLCSAKSGISLETYFWETIHIWIKDTSYYKGYYEDEIKISATISATYWTHWYEHNWKVSEDYKNSLYNLFYEKESKVATLNYTYQGISDEKQNTLLSINSYYDEKVKQLLFQDLKILPNSLFSIAIANKKYLELSADQCQAIINKGIELSNILKNNIKPDSSTNAYVWKFERNSLTLLLQEEQYNKLLVLKNTGIAALEAQVAWNDLVKKGFSKKYDSTLVLNQFKNYFLTVAITRDYFEDDKEAQEKHLIAFKNQIPEPLKRLDNSKNGAAKNQPYRGTFLW